jgi:cytochrome c oxidase subunit 3
MSLIARLSEKSWETPGIDGLAEPESYRPAAVRVGLLVYLGVATFLFGLITAAYVMRMGIHGGTGEHNWHSLPKPILLWVDTGALILASIAWEWARLTGRRLAVATAGALGLLFLIGQLLVWRQMADAGYALGGSALCLTAWSDLGSPAIHLLPTNPALGFFYMITAIHGAHIAGGLVAWGRTIDRLSPRLIELSAIYWHFLLLVWLAMFALMLAT